MDAPHDKIFGLIPGSVAFSYCIWPYLSLVYDDDDRSYWFIISPATCQSPYLLQFKGQYFVRPWTRNTTRTVNTLIVPDWLLLLQLGYFVIIYFHVMIDGGGVWEDSPAKKMIAIICQISVYVTLNCI